MLGKPAIRLLIVDDYVDTLIEFQEIFERAGYKVYTAKNTKEAFDIFQEYQPQICLVDVIIPNPLEYSYLSSEPGFALMRKIKEVSPRSKCVAFASASENVLYAAKEFGADDMIRKPADPLIIIDKLNIIALEFALQEEK